MKEYPKKIVNIEIDGVVKEAEIISLFELQEFGKDYVIYTFNEEENGNQRIMVSTLKIEQDNYIFDNIKTEEEWQRIKKVIKNQSEINAA